MYRGYIKIYRKMLDSKSASRGANYIAMMVYLLLKACWNEGAFKGKVLAKGEVAFTLPALAHDLGLSVQTVRTVLKNLSQDGFISVEKSTDKSTDKSTGKFTTVTICNFSIYQAQNTDGQQINQHDDQQTTNRQLTDIEEGKKENNIIKKTLIAPACVCEGDAEKILGPELAEDFNRFLYVWKDTHGKGKEMNVFQQEAQLRTLIGIPEEQRKEAIQRAIRGGWKALHNLDELGKTPAPGAQPVRAAKKRYNPADPSTW